MRLQHPSFDILLKLTKKELQFLQSLPKNLKLEYETYLKLRSKFENMQNQIVSSNFCVDSKKIDLLDN